MRYQHGVSRQVLSVLLSGVVMLFSVAAGCGSGSGGKAGGGQSDATEESPDPASAEEVTPVEVSEESRSDAVGAEGDHVAADDSSGDPPTGGDTDEASLDHHQADPGAAWAIALESCRAGFESCEPLTGYLRARNYLRVVATDADPPGGGCNVSLLADADIATQCPGFPCAAEVSFPEGTKHATIAATAICGGEERTHSVVLPVLVPSVEQASPCVRWAEWIEEEVAPPGLEVTSIEQATVELDDAGRPHLFGVVMPGRVLTHVYRSADGVWHGESITERKPGHGQFAAVRDETGSFRLVAQGVPGDLETYYSGFFEYRGKWNDWNERQVWPVGTSCSVDCPFATGTMDDDGVFEILAAVDPLPPDCYEKVPEELQPFCDVVVTDTPLVMRVRMDPTGNLSFLGPYHLSNFYRYFSLSLVNVSGPGAVGFYRGMAALGFLEIHGEELTTLPLCEDADPIHPDLCPGGCTWCDGLVPARVFSLPDKTGVGTISQFFDHPDRPKNSHERLIFVPGASPVYEILPTGYLAEQRFGDGSFTDWQKVEQSDDDRAVMDGLGRNHFVAQWEPPVIRDPIDRSEQHSWEALVFFSEFGSGEPTDWTMDVLTMAPWPISRAVTAMNGEGTTYVFAAVKDDDPSKAGLRVWTRSCVEYYEPLEP